MQSLNHADRATSANNDNSDELYDVSDEETETAGPFLGYHCKTVAAAMGNESSVEPVE